MKKKKYVDQNSNGKALNIVRKVDGGKYQVFQVYAGTLIPLLGRRTASGFIQSPARTVNEAFDRLYREYYE